MDVYKKMCCSALKNLVEVLMYLSFLSVSLISSLLLPSIIIQIKCGVTPSCDVIDNHCNSRIINVARN